LHHLDFIYLAGFALLYGLVSQRLERTFLTAPILAVAYGVALGPLGLGALQLDIEGGAVRLLAELTLALVLFHDAARIDLRLVRKNLGTPERLLGPGLLLTIALGTALGWLLLGRTGAGGELGLGIWDVALLGAMLAPTDAALGHAVVTQEAVPPRVRQALNIESGLNDGLCVPIVAVLMACAAGAAGATGAADAVSAWTWARHALEAAGYGVGVGVAVGALAARLLDAAQAAGWMRPGAHHIAVAAVPILAFFSAEALHGSGFLAAFLSGLALGSTTRHLQRDLYHFTEDASELLGLVTWIAFGVAAAPFALRCGTPVVIGYALLSLTIVRMLPVGLALLGSGFARETVLFIGWFGPRGLATVVFALAVLGSPAIAARETIFGVAVWTVLLSVVLHGTTAGALARRYGATCSRRAAAAPTRVDGADDLATDLVEGLPVPDLPLDRSQRAALRSSRSDPRR